MSRLALAFVVLLLSFGAGARAEISSADQDALRAIVSAQIEAFRHDDGAAAYSYAAPGIRGLFPTADEFMRMVRNAYQPVYRPRSVTFGDVAETSAGIVQRVFLTGPDGRGWIALYSFERQPDGSWKINGVRLIEDKGTTI